METVTICGSIRFEKTMRRIAFLLETKYNFNVIQCTYNEDKLEMTKDEYQNLVQAHHQKIMLSDAIFVVDVDGYIGKQTKKEILFAETNKREVIYYSEFIKEN